MPAGALVKPRACAVIPHRTSDPEGFVETDNTCDCGNPVIVSIGAVKELARVAGLPSEQELESAESRAEEAEADAAALQTAFDALTSVRKEVAA